MKMRYEKISIRELCGLFGKSRLAWYDRLRREEAQVVEYRMVLDMVQLIREELPQAGTPMLYRILKPKLAMLEIKMGRTALHRLLLENGLTLRRKRARYPKTTDSKHWLKKWPNLIRDLEPLRPLHVWVADITYLRLQDDDFCFLSLLTDAYSKLVVGWCLNPSLCHRGPLQALNMALETFPERKDELIHHSDRGSQYCSKAYVDCLQKHGVSISMTENKDPYENPIAERINGTMKNYLGLNQRFPSLETARAATADKIRIYNQVKPHSSCDYLTPMEAHQNTGPMKQWWRKNNPLTE